MTGKPVKRVDLSKLTPAQREALAQFYKDCRAAAPHMKEMQDTARKVFNAWLAAPEWHMNEGHKPEQPPPADPWSVKPEVNYVDHIEGAP